MRISKAFLAGVALAVSQPALAAIPVIAEVEPNNSLATAQALPTSNYSPVLIRGSLEGNSLGFVDYFSFFVDSSLPFNYSAPRDIYFEITGLDGAAPLVSLFGPDGYEYDFTSGPAYNNIRYVTRGTWTAAVKRAPVASATNYTLLISIVPEPSTWALMLAGFGMVGYMLRKRRVSVALAPTS